MRLTWLLEVHTSVRFCFQFQSPDQKHVLVERLSLSMYWFFPPTQKDSCQTIIMNKLLADRRGVQINHKDMSSARSDERTFTSQTQSWTRTQSWTPRTLLKTELALIWSRAQIMRLYMVNATRTRGPIGSTLNLTGAVTAIQGTQREQPSTRAIRGAATQD